MLRYLGTGGRRYGLHPMYVHRRANWEFLAVLEGRCGVTPPGAGPPLRSRHLWLFPPEVAHGWTGEGAEACEVAVFHFGTVPPLLQRVAVARGGLDRSLPVAAVRRLRELVAELQPHYRRMTEKSLLVFERALLELSLLMLEDLPEPAGSVEAEAGLRKIEAALAWHAEHMAERPKIEEVAKAVHVSVRHLRRLFHEVRAERPHDAFTSQRLHRAMERLAHAPMKLEQVARECGFASGSDFCRVFQARHKVSPGAWRRRLSPQCSAPGAVNPAVTPAARLRRRKETG